MVRILYHGGVRGLNAGDIIAGGQRNEIANIERSMRV